MALGPTSVDDIVKAVRPHTRPIRWPSWVPMDEELSLEPTGEPLDIDPHLWSGIREAFLSVFPLETDQIFFGLGLTRLEMDSLDIVVLVSNLEDRLGIIIEDEMAYRFESASTVGDVYKLIQDLPRTPSGPP
ncbi:MAG: acyl carrier protein [Verrucomicrobia bacterium]|nr:acyl carrier protein [Verrucomicrobiota bacterium]